MAWRDVDCRGDCGLGDGVAGGCDFPVDRRDNEIVGSRGALRSRSGGADAMTAFRGISESEDLEHA